MLEEGLTSVAKLVEALTIWWCLRLFSHGAGFEVQEVGYGRFSDQEIEVLREAHCQKSSLIALAQRTPSGF